VADGEAGRWLTYAEAGQALGGISPEAARQLARRRNWPRRTPNAYGDKAMVLVPDETAADGPRRTAVIRATTHDRADGRDRPDVHAMLETIRMLREAADTANARLDAAAEERRQLGEERRELLTALADARTAAMISGSEAAALRAQFELLAVRRPWWRRWFR
jgi:hypothetical protein